MRPLTPEKIERVVVALSRAAEKLSADTGASVQPTDVEEALVEALNLTSNEDLLDQDLSAQQIVAALSKFNFGRLHPRIIEKVELHLSIIPCDVAAVSYDRMGGEVWTIPSVDTPNRPVR